MNQHNSLSIDTLNNMSSHDAEQWFSQTCAAPKWFINMALARPFSDLTSLTDTAKKIWQQCSTDDFLIAFEAHPMIGDVSTLRERYAATKNMASNEQQGAAEADEDTLQELATANHAYLEKHGFIFIICASGLCAQTMLEALKLRLKNDTATEVELAAAEQIKITLLRLEKGIHTS